MPFLRSPEVSLILPEPHLISGPSRGCDTVRIPPLEVKEHGDLVLGSQPGWGQYRIYSVYYECHFLYLSGCLAIYSALSEGTSDPSHWETPGFLLHPLG